LDELPQLFNVMKGEMSLVGPRPDIPFAVGMYKDWHRKRLCVKPGITGLWQVSGRKGLSFEDMVHLDIAYIRKRSLPLDAKILILTIGTILRRDGS
jgi:lipopolysaccharide/colanic/teichoic acid biosynthesis glycosyltransferase